VEYLPGVFPLRTILSEVSVSTDSPLSSSTVLQVYIDSFLLPVDLTTAKNVSLTYFVYFALGFNFVCGGKLPGLFGGKKGCSGGQTATNYFSTRMMFKNGGLGEVRFESIISVLLKSFT
jgi:hypothetical protein